MTDNQRVAEIEARLELAKGTGIDSVMVCGFYRHDVETLLQALAEATRENERLRGADAFTLIDYANLIDSKYKAAFVSFYFHGGDKVPRDERIDIFTQTCPFDTEVILDLVENDLENVIAKEHDYYCILHARWDGDIWSIVEYHIENCTELNFPIQSLTQPKGDPNAN